MIGLDRQGWILVGFAVLFFAAVTVSACGWVLLWRIRRAREETAAAAPDEGETAPLPPANPPR